jgi:hypothetical protein
VHPTVAAFLTAAEVGDVTRLHELIDWPTSGVARFVASLREVPETRRPELARQGLTEMLAPASGRKQHAPLGALALRLREHPRAVPLDRTGVEALIERARPATVPANIPDDIVQAVDRLRDQINGIEDAYRLTYRKVDEIGLGVLPQEDRLTLVRRFHSH